VLVGTVVALPSGLGKAKTKVKFAKLFSKSAAVNWLSAARLFLFSARDVWFVVGLPRLSGLGTRMVVLAGWRFRRLMVVGYGMVQAMVPEILRNIGAREGVTGDTARLWAFYTGCDSARDSRCAASSKSIRRLP